MDKAQVKIMSVSIFNRLQALSDPLRVRILRVLVEEEFKVGELCSILQSPQSTISRHLKILHEQGWLHRKSEGVINWFSCHPKLLPEDCKRLWDLVQAQTQALSQEDLHRMNSVQALRAVNSEEFFRRVGHRWLLCAASKLHAEPLRFFLS